MRTMQSSYAAGVLAPSLRSRTDLAKWQIGLSEASNLLVHVHGGISNRPGTYYVGEAVGANRKIPFEYSVTDTYVLEFSELKLRVIRNGAYVESGGSAYEIASPYSYDDMAEVRFVQREDVMYLTHKGYVEQALTRTAHDNWTFAAVTHVPTILAPASLAGAYLEEDGTAAAAADTKYDIEYQVAAITSDGSESLPTAAITIGAETSASWTAGNYVNLTWDTVADANQYVVYKSSRGYFGFIGSTEGLTFRDDNIAPDSADGPKSSRNPFDGADNQPQAVGIHQQRKAYGATTNQPQTAWLTVTGSMDDLSVSRPLKDGDAITAQLDSNRVNEFLHFVALKDLVAVTNNGVWTLSSGSNHDILTPTTLRYDLQDASGGSNVPPIVTGNTILMVPSYRQSVKEMFFQIQSNGFEGSDLDIMSNHLFATDRIKEWAYQRDKSRIWCVMDSGAINVLTYMREHDVVAWTTGSTDGEFTSVCSVRDAERDVLYFTVKREINGSDVYYTEFLTERLPDEDLESSVFMDCAVSYNGSATDTFTGADHLAGETCVVLADGNVVEDVEVSAAGGFTLPYAYTKVHIGLSYVADFETLDVDFNLEDGTAFGKRKTISEVTLALENTRGLNIGPDKGNLLEMADRTTEGYDEHTRMLTGKYSIHMSQDWGTKGRVHVQQKYPLPMTILAHIPEILYES